MNKNQLIEIIANDCDISKAKASQIIDLVFESIIKSVKEGIKATFIGFGTFELKKRAERKARNPRTNEMMVIPEKNVPVFKAGKGFKDSVK